MKLNVRSIPDRGLKIEEEVSAEVFSEGAGLTLAQPARVSVNARKIHGGFHVKAEATAEIKCECVRCLEPTVCQTTGKFDIVYQPFNSDDEYTQKQLEDRDLGIRFFKGNEIDLAPEIRQTVLLNLPTKPMCSSDCKGLCPNCGANRNQEQCGCEEERRESPRGPFASLFAKLKENESGPTAQ